MDARAQTAPWKGVVWVPPSAPSEILADFSAMRAMGVNAVRTGIVRDERILALADSFQIQIFQDLPVVNLSAAALLDTLAFAQQLLENAVARSAPYRSARHFGLATYSDTSVPAACRYFAAQTRTVQRLQDAVAYYISAFIEDDQCAHEVDLVLLDALEAADPADRVRRWTHPMPVGLSAVGRYASGEATGLLNARSDESQARYLESSLNALLQTSTKTIFVYRWRDESEHAYAYGLLRSSGADRPARDVVQGLFSGSQRTFSFPLGASALSAFPWYLVLGWLAIGLTGILYHKGLRFRNTLTRYFLSHNFYVESIRNGRELLYGSTTLLLFVQALCAGVISGVALESIQHHSTLDYVLHLLPATLKSPATGVLRKPWALVGVVALLYVTLFLLLPIFISIAYRWLTRISIGRAYMIVIWPNWYLLPLALAAMTADALPAASASRVITLICGVWLLMAGKAAVRQMLDLARLNPRRSILVFTYSCVLPLLIASGIAFTVSMVHPGVPSSLEFLWHLATRT